MLISAQLQYWADAGAGGNVFDASAMFRLPDDNRRAARLPLPPLRGEMPKAEGGAPFAPPQASEPALLSHM